MDERKGNWWERAERRDRKDLRADWRTLFGERARLSSEWRWTDGRATCEDGNVMDGERSNNERENNSEVWAAERGRKENVCFFFYFGEKSNRWKMCEKENTKRKWKQLKTERKRRKENCRKVPFSEGRWNGTEQYGHRWLKLCW